jgi:hypothetical protein
MRLVRHVRRPFIVAAALAVSLWFLPGRAGAQADIDRFNRQLEQIQRQTILQIDQNLSLDQRAYFDYGGYAVVGYLSADDNVNDNHVLRQYQAYGYARFNPDGGANEFFLRGTWTWQNFNEGDAFNNHDDNNNQGDVDRWYYKFDLARYQQAYYGKQIDYDISVKVGRDLQIWGNGLVLSEDIMGVDARFSWGKTDLTLLGGLTPDNTTDIDTSRPDFDDDTQRGFYGVMLSHDFNGHKPYIYFLSQQDYNSQNVSFTGPVKTTFDYNSWYIGLGSTGPIGDKIVYGVELAYEGGSALSNSVDVTTGLTPLTQVNEDIQAFGGDARLDYLFSDGHHSRVSGEVIAATGDNDRLISTTNTFGGNKAGTHDRAFNAFGLLNTGLAYAPAVSNLLAFRVGGSTFPLPTTGAMRRLQIGTDVFIYNKFNSDAPIDEPSFDNRYLGWEPDFYLNWQITSDVTINARYGVFFPSSDAFQSDDTRQYIYGGLTYAF